MVVYEFSPFQLDADHLLLHLDGAPIALGPKVVETLLALVEREGEIITKNALVARIWPEGYVEESNLTQNIYVLRKLLRAHGCEAAIETVARRGYRFAVPVGRCDRLRRPARRSIRMPLAAAATAAALALAGAMWAYGPSRESNPALSSTQARLYSIGSFYLTTRTRYGVERSIAFFSRAIAREPRNPRNYAALASAYAVMADYGYGRATPQQDRARAKTDARRALALDPRCGTAYAALGLIAFDAHLLDRALQDLRVAVTLAPNDDAAHEWYGIALIAAGRINDAAAQLRWAQRLNPLSVATTAWLSSAAYLGHRYDDAIAYARQGLAIAPQRSGLWMTLGLAQEAQGHNRAAISSFSRYARLCTGCRPEAAALLAYTYTRLHDLARARAELAVARADADGVRPEDLALALAVVGERGIAIRWLRKRMTSEDRVVVANDPRFDILSGSERSRLLTQSRA